MRGPFASVQSMAGHIEALTGHRPDSCPWRSVYDPLVAEVVRVAQLADKGLALAELGDDPPAILLDAMSVYYRAFNATRGHDMELERKQREAQVRDASRRR